MNFEILTKENTYSRISAIRVLRRSQQFLYTAVKEGTIRKLNYGKESRYSKTDINDILKDRGDSIIIGMGEDSLEPINRTEGSVGSDLGVILYEPYILKPNEIKIFDTGLKLYIPKNAFMMIVSRSSCSSKGIVILNSPGIIDSDYTGEIKLIVMNLGKISCTIKHHDRLAQLIPMEHYSGSICSTKELDLVDRDTERGSGGFGSTGI